MAFKDYMTKYPTLGNLVEGFIGDSLAPAYRKQICDMFVWSCGVALALMVILWAFDADRILLTGLCAWTGHYCGQSISYFHTDEGRGMVDARANTPEGIPDLLNRYWTVVLVAIVGLFSALFLVPAFTMGVPGLVWSAFLLVGSPAIIWFRFRKEA